MCLEIEDPSNTITLPLNTHIASSNLLQFANKISIKIVSFSLWTIGDLQFWRVEGPEGIEKTVWSSLTLGDSFTIGNSLLWWWPGAARRYSPTCKRERSRTREYLALSLAVTGDGGFEMDWLFNSP